MSQDAFAGIDTIPFVERSSKEPLGFRHYRPDEMVEGLDVAAKRRRV